MKKNKLVLYVMIPALSNVLCQSLIFFLRLNSDMFGLKVESTKDCFKVKFPFFLEFNILKTPNAVLSFIFE